MRDKAETEPMPSIEEQRMSRDEAAIEREIQAKGLNAPRLNPAHVDGQIIGEEYIQRGDWPRVQTGDVDRALGCLTVCILVLKNGFTVVGKAACASPENFDAELGRKIAREDARNQIWALEGYRLRSEISALESVHSELAGKS